MTHFSWWEFFLVVLVLAGIYFILFEIQQFTKHSSFSGRFQNQFKELFRRIFIVYESLAIVILGAVFVFINPPLHGLILFFLIFGSWNSLSSYISGRWVHFDNSIREGIELKSGDLQGIVSKLGRTKLHLQTSEGLHHVNYYRLLREDYTLISGKTIGGFYHLALSPRENLKEVKNHRLHLLDLFATAPYIDWHHKPDVFQDEDAPDTVDATVLIKEESHLHELIALIKEWGYNCRLSA